MDTRLADERSTKSVRAQLSQLTALPESHAQTGIKIMASNALKRTYLETTVLNNGIQVYKNGNYGQISLQLSCRKSEEGNPIYAYVIAGVNNRTGHFPGVREWHLAIRALPSASWSKNKRHFRVEISSANSAKRINDVLSPILMASIVEFEKSRQEGAVRQKEYFRAKKAFADSQLLLGGALTTEESVDMVRELRGRLLNSGDLVRVAANGGPSRLRESDEFKRELVKALAPLLETHHRYEVGGNEHNKVIALSADILFGSGHLWEALRARAEIAKGKADLDRGGRADDA